jgi:hypothetical protein
MKVFLFNSHSQLSEYFQEESFNIPFLGSTLFDYNYNSYERLAVLINKTLQIFVPPEWDGLLENTETYINVPQNLSNDFELIFFTDLFNIPFLDFSHDDYHFIIQNPNKLFSHASGLKVGYLNNQSEISKLSEDLHGFSNILRLTNSNFLKINQTLINNYSGSPSPNTYGSPVIACPSSNIVNSKIAGPCFLGEDVKIFNSIIYPGTILTGRTVIQNSEVFESFICESEVKNSTVKNTLSVLSSLFDVDLKDSVVPRGSVIFNERKR